MSERNVKALTVSGEISVLFPGVRAVYIRLLLRVPHVGLSLTPGARGAKYR